MKRILIFIVLLILMIPLAYANVWKSIIIADDATGENGASGIYASDIDGDGDIDFVGAINVNDEIRWYENLGNETYQNYTIASVNGVSNVWAADMDNDGDIDIVSGADAGADSNGLQVYLNDGSESFSTSVIDTTRSRPIHVIDFDGDGDNDIVSGTIIEDTVLLWLNNGAASFTCYVVDSACDQVNDVDVFDIDSDGDYDIMATCSGGVLRESSWYENDGSNTNFIEHIIESPITDNPDGITAGDLDMDGDIDIATIDDNSISWWKNDGSETFIEIPLTASITTGRRLSIIDLDNDGDNDLVFSHDALEWYDNLGTGTFNLKTIYNPASNMRGMFTGDFDGDNDIDVAIADETGDEFRWFQNSFVTLRCPYPMLFCDDFNYVTAMSTRNWEVEVGIGNIDTTYTPINNIFDVTRDKRSIIARHETSAFQSTYRPDSGSRYTRHIYAPVFSSEFTLNFRNATNNIFEYQADQKFFQTAFIIRATTNGIGNSSGDMSWGYLDDPDLMTYTTLCDNCTSSNTNLHIKIISYFAQRESFPFNSSVRDDEIRLYSDGTLIGTIEDYLYTTDIEYLSRYHITKFNVGNFTLDNYYVMVGTDKDTPTIDNYYEDFYKEDIWENATFGTGQSGDLAAALGTIWDDMGLLSTASRIMSGLFLMFLLALIMFAMALKTGHALSARVLIVVEMFFMVLLVFIKLLPVWLPFVIVLISAGIGAAVMKMGTQT